VRMRRATLAVQVYNGAGKYICPLDAPREKWSAHLVVDARRDIAGKG